MISQTLKTSIEGKSLHRLSQWNSPLPAPEKVPDMWLRILWSAARSSITNIAYWRWAAI
jgi:hypothetical protein